MADYKSGWTGAEIDAGIQAARNALPKSGGTMTGALTLNGTPTSDNQAATKKYVDDVAKGAVYIPGMNGKCAYNLLDNSWFVNPINQRGKTSYSGSGYTIDRWRLTNDYSKLEIVNGGIKVSCMDGGSNAYPRQHIDGTNLGGKTLTGVWCFDDGSIYTLTAVFPQEDVASDTVLADIAVGGKYRLTLSKLKNGCLTHQARIPVGESLIIKWAALYEGEYTAETLPPYVYKGYAVELAECQRYFYRLKSYWKWAAGGICTSATEAYIPITLPQSMRAMPAVTIEDKSLVKIRCGAVASQVPSALDWGNVDSMYRTMHLKATVNGATTGDVAFLYMDNAAIIDFSADL